MNKQRTLWGVATGGAIALVVLGFSLRDADTVIGKSDGGKSQPRDVASLGLATANPHDDIKRDPFYGEKPVRAAPRNPTLPRQSSAPPTAPAAFVDALPQEAATIKYIGYLLRDGRTHALVLFAGEPMVVAVGNQVGGRYSVKRIEQEALFLQGQGGGEARVELSGE